MPSRYFILVDRQAVPCNLHRWVAWFVTHDRHVAHTELPGLDKPVRVSTVFLGLDHRYFSSGPPILFESLVFGGPLDGDMYRYCTWDEAAVGHAMLVDEAAVEGQVAVWEVRRRLQAIAADSRIGHSLLNDIKERR